MEKLLEEILFEAPKIGKKKIKVDRKMVQSRLGDLAKDVDLSRYIL